MRVKDEEQIASRRALIMRAAREIMETQGMEALSIRKIAAMIQQTPGIIYHYFSGKEELMLAVVHILGIIQQTMASEKSPAAQLRATLFGYVRGMLEDPLLYQVVMQSKLPSVQKQTAILQENLRQHRKSIAMLCTCLEEGIACGEFSVEQVELRAQGIWCCVYGLLERILIEQPVPAYRDKVIEEVLDLIMASLRPHETA